MKKFIIRLVVLALICSCIILCFNYLYVNSKAYGYYYSQRGTEKFNDVPQNIMIANFGSSHGRNSFTYENYPTHTAFNFALSSQTLVYDYNILDYYKENISPDAVIIIPISYFSLYRKDDEGMNTEKNDRYYSFLDKEHIENYKLYSYISYAKLPILDSLFPSVYAYAKSDGHTDENVVKKASDDKEIDITGFNRFQFHWLDRMGGNSDIEQSQYNALINMLELCRENDYTPVLVTTPFLPYYSNHFPDDFFEKFHEDVKDICDNYDIIYWDYSRDERFINNLDLFSDTDHLNHNGAIKFTDIVIEDLRNANLLR